MKSESIFGLAIVLIGGLFLFRNLGILPKMSFNLLWPLIIIGMGVLALLSTSKDETENRLKLIIDDTEHEINNPFLAKLIIIGVSVFTIIIVGFVLVGVLAPIFLLLLLGIPLIILLVLGATLLKIVLPLLIAIFIIAAPILFIIWLLSLIF
ncbi:MAG: hypothetical protein GX208_05380 [Firmicutes bacterium]|nr:hypothetical protein [Bacillota bacterium]